MNSEWLLWGFFHSFRMADRAMIQRPTDVFLVGKNIRLDVDVAMLMVTLYFRKS